MSLENNYDEEKPSHQTAEVMCTSRRGFLKGVGAAGLTVSLAPIAGAAPLPEEGARVAPPFGTRPAQGSSA